MLRFAAYANANLRIRIARQGSRSPHALKAVELRFRQWVKCLLVQWGLRSHDHKKFRQFARETAYGHQRSTMASSSALCTGGRAVDFIGQN